MTGSLSLSTYVICDKCTGILSTHDESAILEHFASCKGDLKASTCTQFAVDKSVLLELQMGPETSEISITKTSKKRGRRKRKAKEEFVPIVVKQEKLDPDLDSSSIRRSKRTPKPKYKYNEEENATDNTVEITLESTENCSKSKHSLQKTGNSGKENQGSNEPIISAELTESGSVRIMAESSDDLGKNFHKEDMGVITLVQDISGTNTGEEVMECEDVEEETRATLEAIIEAKTEPLIKIESVEEKGSGKGSYAEKKQQLLEEYAQYREETEEEDSTKVDIYRCPKCKERTFRANFIGMFSRHVRTCKPSGSEELKCPEPECTFIAKDAKRFSEHKRYHLQPYMCEFCPQRFSDKRNMIEHRMKHTDERPYACDSCDYRTRNKRLLKEHKRKHTGELLPCPESGCGFRTAYAGSLASHVELRHRTTAGSTVPRPHPCPRCPAFAARTRASLQRHLATVHGPGGDGSRSSAPGAKLFQCSMCPYVAATKFAVISHLRSHTKEKIYFCDKCDYAASYASAFRQHMMTHLGLKTWQCRPCGYNSNTRAKVSRHLATRHPNVPPASAVVNLGLSLKLDLATFRRPATERKYQLEEVVEGDVIGEVMDEAIGGGAGEEVRHETQQGNDELQHEMGLQNIQNQHEMELRNPNTMELQNQHEMELQNQHQMELQNQHEMELHNGTDPQNQTDSVTSVPLVLVPHESNPGASSFGPQHEHSESETLLGVEEVVVADEVMAGGGEHELIVMTESGQIVIPQTSTLAGSALPVHEFHIQAADGTQHTGQLQVISEMP